MALRQIGILYQSHLALATELSERLAEQARRLRLGVWRRSSWEENLEQVDVSGTGLIVSIGGDGTLLRVARVAAPWGIPILGVNAGRLGFLAEIEGEAALDALPAILESRGWVEERTMLLVEHKGSRWYAINEAVVSRAGPARVVQITLRVDGTLLTSFRGDGILLSTATGSTAYNLAAGGPVFPPTAPYIIAKALSPHPVSEAAIVLEPSALIEVAVRTEHGAVLSIDGQEDTPVANGDAITVRRSPYQARFLRLRPPGYFYEMLRDLLSGARKHPDILDALPPLREAEAAPQEREVPG